MTLIDRKNEILNLTQGEHWYIVKQNLVFSELCYAVLIVEKFIEDSKDLSFEEFFTEEARNLPISNLNYRMTVNCYYLGLLHKNGSSYKDARPSEVYYKIKKLCKGNFQEISSYEQLIINQIEKVHTTNELDEKCDTLRKDFNILPTFFLYKVLILIGDITGKYEISLDEFKLFLGTAKQYSLDYYSTTISAILEYRKEKDFKIELDAVKSKFLDNRFNKLFDNLPYLENGLKIKDIYINKIKEKVYNYELGQLNIEKSIDFLTKSATIDKALQKIFYGSPGTGKSYKIKELTSQVPKEQVERITFHPEYDYHSFVGGYKPIMEDDKIKYQFVPQIFTNIYVKAWQTQDKDFYLVIEEINRGNCAEIFGDIFQLLDREKESIYEVTPSEELRKYLEQELPNNCEKLTLPSNLHILATMNTSDQSLFPMDSAFKRRWEWEYVSVNYEVENNPSAEFIINLSDTETFKWIDFIKAVNNKYIKNNPDLGMDKCIGNYFIKADKNNEIDLKTFINKAIFYLWNDVFKDESEDKSIFRNRITYEDLFPIESKGIEKVKDILILLEVEIQTKDDNSAIE